MAEPQRPEAQDKPPFDEAEFLRRTFDRSLQEMERSRVFFERLLKWTLWAGVAIFTLGVGLLGIFGFRSWNDIQTRMDKELNTTKEAIITQGNKTINDIQTRMNSELKTTKDAIVIQGKKAISETDNIIRVNAAAAFQDESIRGYVRDVAKEKTDKELNDIIQQSVNNQVASRIIAEGPQIKNTVVVETKKAVSDLNPFISSEVKSEVQKQSTENLEPLRQEVKNYQEIVKISALALVARNGNAGAYDQIQKIASSTKDANIKEVCVSTINQIFVDMNSGLYSGRKFIPEKTVEEMKKLLVNPNPLARWAAVDGLAAKNDKSLVANFIEISNRDDSMWVRRAAYQALKGLTDQNFENFQEEQWNNWWEQNKKNWPPK